MIWNLILWVAVAFLVVTLLWRLIASRRPKPASEATGSGPSPADRVFGRGWLAPVAAVVLALVALGFMYVPQFFRQAWSESEQVEVDHFIEAISMYQDASSLSQKRGVGRGDWESINAMLQATQSEVEQVGDSVLRKIDPELPNMVHEKFIPGLRIGAFGLRWYTGVPQKGRDTVEHHRDDSLKLSRDLLDEWNAWFTAHKADIMSKLE